MADAQADRARPLRAGERLRAEAISKRFGERVVLESVGFSIAAGETVALLGPNGTGKSTLTAILAGLLRPDEGAVRIATSAADPRRALGFVPQQLALYPMLTVEQNLRFMAELYQVSGARARIRAALETLGLEARARDRVEILSGGLQRRLAIAMALLHDPAFLLLDEPTAGVDPQSREQIFALLQARAAAGAAVLFTTHQIADAERSCDRVMILADGRMLLDDSVAQIVAKHGSGLVELEIDGGAARVQEAIGALQRAGVPGELDAQPQGLRCASSRPEDLVGVLMRTLENAGVEYRSARIVPPSLEAAFLHLTGRKLRA